MNDIELMQDEGKADWTLANEQKKFAEAAKGRVGHL